MQGLSAGRTDRTRARARRSSLARTGPYLELTARRAESPPRSSGTGFPTPVRRRPGRDLRTSRPSPPIEKERFVPDEPMEDRPRRRPVLLAMLVAAAILVAIAGSGAFAGNGGSRSSDDSTGVPQGVPPAAQQNGGQGFMQRGRK